MKNMCLDHVQEKWTVFRVLLSPRKALDDMKSYALLLDGKIDHAERMTKENNENAKALREIHYLIEGEKSPYYSWQRVWQNVARMKYGLKPDCSMEDIRVAILLDVTREPRP